MLAFTVPIWFWTKQRYQVKEAIADLEQTFGPDAGPPPDEPVRLVCLAGSPRPPRFERIDGEVYWHDAVTRFDAARGCILVEPGFDPPGVAYREFAVRRAVLRALLVRYLAPEPTAAGALPAWLVEGASALLAGQGTPAMDEPVAYAERRFGTTGPFLRRRKWTLDFYLGSFGDLLQHYKKLGYRRIYRLRSPYVSYGKAAWVLAPEPGLRPQRRARTARHHRRRGAGLDPGGHYTGGDHFTLFGGSRYQLVESDSFGF